MTMKLLFPMCLAGAVIGGFPGGWIAFFFAAKFVSATGGSNGEAICITVNLLLAIGGAFIGALLATTIRGQPKLRFNEIVVLVFLGVLCGVGGYAWVYWEIINANPPL